MILNSPYLKTLRRAALSFPLQSFPKTCLFFSLVTVLSFLSFPSNGQGTEGTEGPEWMEFCATTGEEERRKKVYEYQSSPSDRKTTAASDTIPLSIVLVGASDSTGTFPIPDLFRAVCELNEDFKDVGFYFYIQYPIRYLYHDRFYIHNSSDGGLMMNTLNLPEVVNIYVVMDPAGACGYFSPSLTAVALSIKCLGPGSNTFTHELGHFFGLPHTFSGWEWGTPSQPEWVNRQNCKSTGDGFCDTEADYSAYRWQCPYLGNHVDPIGDTLRTDGSLFMSYSNDACKNRFSPEQMDYIRYFRGHFDFGNHPPVPNPALSNPQILYPSSFLFADQRYVKWNAVPGASEYYVRVIQKISQRVLFEDLISDTIIQLNKPLVHQNLYEIQIMPISERNVCHPFLKHGFTFLNQNMGLSPQSPPMSSDWFLYPNPAKDQPISMNWGSLPFGQYEWSMSNVMGQVIDKGSIDYHPGQAKSQWPTERIPSGIYHFRILHRETGWQSTQRLWIRPSNHP